jgi:hypothetical protein
VDRPRTAIDLKKNLVAHLEAVRATSDSIVGMKSPSQTEILSERVLRWRGRRGIAIGTLTAAVVVVTGVYFVHWPFSRPQGTPVPAPLVQLPAMQQPPAPPPPAESPAAKPAPTPPAAAPAAPAAAANVPPTAPAPNAPHAQPHKRRQTAESSPTSSAAAHVPPRLEPKSAERRVAGKPAAHADDDDRMDGSGDDVATAAVAKAETAFSDGRLASARVSATEAVAAARKASPNLKVRAFIILGKVELASEEFAAAERTFDRALAIDPKQPVARKGKERAHEAAAKTDSQ